MKRRNRNERKNEKEAERKVTAILDCDKLSAIKSYLEKDHAIDCLFLLYMKKGRWGPARDFMRAKIKKHISDGTFRARMIELLMLGLATYENIGKNPNQKHYLITDFGKNIAELFFRFFDGIQ